MTKKMVKMNKSFRSAGSAARCSTQARFYKWQTRTTTAKKAFYVPRGQKHMAKAVKNMARSHCE